MHKKFSRVILVLALVSGTVSANSETMTDMLANQLSLQLEASFKVMNDPKLIKANAKYIRSLYDALVEEGFTKEQAIQLVSAELSSKK